MSPVGSVFLGTNMIYKHLYLGVEANAKMFHFKALTQDVLGTTNTHKNNFSYGISARVGALLTPSTLGYIGLGLQNYRWRFHSNTVLNSKNKNKIFFEPAIGMETAVKKNVNLGIQVSQAIRKKFTYISSTKYSSTFRPNMTTAQVRLSFTW
jgi:opacity protein-like surface antigen